MAPNDIAEIRLLKRSVDARKKHDVHFVATLGVELAGGAQAEVAAIEAAAHRKGAANVKAHRPYEPLRVPQVGASRQAQDEPRPIVVGTGPAGAFDVTNWRGLADSEPQPLGRLRPAGNASA